MPHHSGGYAASTVKIAWIWGPAGGIPGGRLAEGPAGERNTGPRFPPDVGGLVKVFQLFRGEAKVAMKGLTPILRDLASISAIIFMS